MTQPSAATPATSAPFPARQAAPSRVPISARPLPLQADGELSRLVTVDGEAWSFRVDGAARGRHGAPLLSLVVEPPPGRGKPEQTLYVVGSKLSEVDEQQLVALVRSAPGASESPPGDEPPSGDSDSA